MSHEEWVGSQKKTPRELVSLLRTIWRDGFPSGHGASHTGTWYDKTGSHSITITFAVFCQINNQSSQTPQVGLAVMLLFRQQDKGYKKRLSQGTRTWPSDSSHKFGKVHKELTSTLDDAIITAVPIAIYPGARASGNLCYWTLFKKDERRSSPSAVWRDIWWTSCMCGTTKRGKPVHGRMHQRVL